MTAPSRATAAGRAYLGPAQESPPGPQAGR